MSLPSSKKSSKSSHSACSLQPIEEKACISSTIDFGDVECSRLSIAEEISSDVGASSSEETMGPTLQNFSIDDSLEEKLKKHGLSRRNVKTIIREFLKDDHIRGLLKANLNDETSSTSLPEPKNLRSKFRKINLTEQDKKFTNLPFPENDDDDEDEDYQPDVLDVSLDTEASQDNSIALCHINAVAENDDEKKDSESEMFDNSYNEAVLANLDECENEFKTIKEQKEIIAKRTRSKHSLLDIAMAEIESSFVPPDSTHDMYMTLSTDDDWNNFLAELQLDDDLFKVVGPVDEDDHDRDPDFDFIYSQQQESEEKEDYRHDPGIEIPKAEVRELKQLSRVPRFDYTGEPLPVHRSREKELAKPKRSFQRNLILSSGSSKLTAKQQLNSYRKKAAATNPGPSSSKPNTLKSANMEASQTEEQQQVDLTFTPQQLSALQTQLRQHIQLLTQLNLLCRNLPSYSTIVHDSHALLKELQQLDEYDRSSMNIPTSYFNASNLNEALSLAQLKIKPSEAVVKLSTTSKCRGPISRNVGIIMATSPVFTFKELLPHVAPTSSVSEHPRPTFTPAEDNLLVLGAAQMQGHQLPWYVLVHQYMIPCKQPDQLRTRYNKYSIRRHGDNPIRLFRVFRQLPNTPPLHSPCVGPGTGVESLLYVHNKDLPPWLLVLQHELENVLPNQRKDETKNASVQGQRIVLSSAQQLSTFAPTFSGHQASGIAQSVSQQPTTFAVMSPIKQQISFVVPAIISATIPSQALLQSSHLISHNPVAEIRKRKLSAPSAKQTGQLINSIKKSFSPTKSKLRRKSSGPVARPKKSRRKEIKETPKASLLVAGDKVSADPIPTTSTSPVTVAHVISGATSTEATKEVPNSIPSTTEADAVTKDSTIEKKKEENVLSTAKSDPTTASTDGQTTEKRPDVPKQATINVETHGPNEEAQLIKNKEEIPVDVYEEEDIEDLTEDDFDEEMEYNLTEVGDELSEEDASEIAKKDPVDKSKKTLKVKWKSRGKSSSKKLGGKLHQLHPGLMGKKKVKSSEDQLSQNLRESAEKVKMLEEETIVQLDPLRGEKEKIFAQGYLKRLEETLADHPDIYTSVLETMVDFDADTSQPPKALFQKLAKLLAPWPDLIQGFAPFLMPEQAYACGLLPEQQVYARARKFLRQLEIRYQDNQQHLNKILQTFRTVSETGIYKEQEMKSTIMSLLKSEPYLQEEFLVFFDDERPPESRFHGDYEEVIWHDDLIKEGDNNNFELVHIPSIGGLDTTLNTNEGHVESTMRSPSRDSRPKSLEENAGVAADTEDEEGTPAENGEPSTMWDDMHASDTEEELADASSRQDKTSPQTFLPDIALISEDALSCSPFKRHNPQQVDAVASRPRTPTLEPSSQQDDQDVSPPSHPPSSDVFSSQGSRLPVTPTGSRSSDGSNALNRSVEHKASADSPKKWTKEEDMILLSECQKHGPTTDTYSKVSEVTSRTTEECRTRAEHLVMLLSGREQTDTDTTSHNSDSESDAEISAE